MNGFQDWSKQQRPMNNFHNDQKLSDDYETPEWLFKILDKKFNFGADMACDSKNCKVKGSPLFDKDQFALEEDWSKWKGTKYVFPPFSKPYFARYLNKAHSEWMRGQESIVLAPLKTLSVEYFQDCKPPLVYVVYPRVRFLFNGSINQMADSICILAYVNDNYVKKPTLTPMLHFLDLSQYLPQTKRYED